VAIDREKVLQAAQAFAEKGRYDKAIAEYQRIIAEDANDARTLLKLGDLETRMGAYQQALETYERVGRIYMQQDLPTKAMFVFKQMREIVTKRVPHLEERYAHITPKLAELYVKLGLTGDALAALDEVATRFGRQGRHQESIDVFRKIVDLAPTNPITHLRLAEALSSVKDSDGAVSEFGIAANLLVRLNRTDDAIKVLERLLHHRPDPQHARTAAELYLARRGATDGMQALSKLQICFQSNPRDLGTLDLLAQSFTLIGQPAKGVEVKKEMARIAREQNNIELARDILLKLAQTQPHDEAVRQMLAELAPAEPQATSMPPEEAELIEEEAELLEEEEAFALEQNEQHGEAPEVVAHVEEPAEAPASVAAQIEQLLSDAQSFQRLRLWQKAIHALQAAIELDPAGIAARVALRDILLEAERLPEAVEEMLAIAALQLDALDGEGAAQTLQDVLTLDATNARAAQMLRELGYELVEESHAQERQHYDANASYDPEAPLPSYELEEADTGYMQAVPAQGQPQASAPPPAAIAHVDDPFASTASDGPLPSFPLEAPESEPSFDLRQPARASIPAEAPTATRPAPTAADIEQALEEAEFFASRGLFEDARAVLADQLSRAPTHPLLRERLGDIEMQEQIAQRGSGTRAMPLRQPMSSVSDGEDFDISASLDALDNLDVAPEAAHVMNEQQQVDVEEVFAKFKEGVAKQISDDDGQAHYDLGVAYKEMGLVDDSLSEFTIAARDPKRACVCWSMVGMIHMERGDTNAAIEAFSKGLASPVRTPEQETVLCFEIGAAYESKRDAKNALTYFQRVARRDPNYRDVQERIRRLSKSDVKAPVRAVAVGAEEDEFDRAFDEMLGSTKLP
jgi:tetratricopeptide (TPR) repeat protein